MNWSHFQTQPRLVGNLQSAELKLLPKEGTRVAECHAQSTLPFNAHLNHYCVRAGRKKISQVEYISYCSDPEFQAIKMIVGWTRPDSVSKWLNFDTVSYRESRTWKKKNLTEYTLCIHMIAYPWIFSTGMDECCVRYWGGHDFSSRTISQWSIVLYCSCGFLKWQLWSMPGCRTPQVNKKSCVFSKTRYRIATKRGLIEGHASRLNPSRLV